MKPSFLFTLLPFLLLGACSTPVPKPPEPVYAMTVKNETDQVAIEYSDGTTIIDIQSPSGIGSAKFDLESEAPPQKLVIHLHLAGLEEFQISFGQTVIAASLSSSGILKGSSQRMISPETETRLTLLHPYWLDIRVISDKVSPSVPRKEGYFEIELSKELLNDLGGSFEIQWIDFYR